MNDKIKRLKFILFQGNGHVWMKFYLQRRFLSLKSRSALLKILLIYKKLLGFKLASNEARSCEGTTTLKQSGLFFLPSYLSKTAINEVVSYFEDKLIYDPYSDAKVFFSIPPESETQKYHIAHHQAHDVLAAPHLMELANHPEILKIAEGFLGAKPTISYISAWWSFATNCSAMQAENFHRDVDGIKFLKLFCFLTDVNNSNGPHVYVLNSASSPKFRDSITRYTDQEIAEEFGEDSINVITGNAGTIFFEDTFGIHKGLKLNSGRRLVFQIIYSYGKLPYSPLSPILDLSSVSSSLNFDPWINRVYYSNSSKL